MSTYLIYRIVNTIDEKCYVGQTGNLQARVAEHFRRLNAGTHQNPRLQEAFNQYGQSAFKVEILERGIGVSKVDGREVHWIKTLDACNNGYNRVVRGAHHLEGQPLEYQALTHEGIKVADEWREVLHRRMALEEEAAELRREEKRLYKLMKEIDRKRTQVLKDNKS